MPIKVLIVEDNQNLRRALKSLIELSDDIVCIGAYEQTTAKISFEKHGIPDVILMDIDLPGENGISFTHRIKEKYPFINILILTVIEQEDKIMEAIYAGASGYLIKSAIPDNILDNIRVLYKGGSPLTPSIARTIFQNINQQKTGKKDKLFLSAREIEVLTGLVKGLTYAKIGKKHFISIDTVRSYIRSIYEKMEVHSRSEAVVRAINEKLV
jgi:DNA-binding NarL/FixJ family response regulator